MPVAAQDQHPSRVAHLVTNNHFLYKNYKFRNLEEEKNWRTSDINI
jgi:hypothetical protein